MRIAAHGLAAVLPPGWEGSIAAEPQETVTAQVRRFAAGAASPEVFPVAHFATFALPADRSDFGGSAVELMGPSDVFVSLLEYASEEAGSALFASRGLPRRLDPRWFSARTLQRTRRGQAGFQHFFHEGGRAFCLYIVLGGVHDAVTLVRRAEQVLATVQIQERA
jgi:hypothetical protein